MHRLTDNTFTFSSTGTSSWTCPAGVTKVTLTISSGLFGANRTGFTVLLDVVPNTTYTITINSTADGTSSTLNSFGSFVWSGGSRLQLRWVE